MQGHLPGKLSREGIEQAEKVAMRLKDEKIDYIYSSDLARAADTAREIAKYHPEAKIEFTKEIREINLGEYTGKKKSDFDFDKMDSKLSYPDPKGGETSKELFERAQKFIYEIIKKHPKDCVLLVGHNGINKNLMTVVMGKGLEEVKEIEKQHNTSVNIFEIDEDGNHKIHALNCIEHLS